MQLIVPNCKQSAGLQAVGCVGVPADYAGHLTWLLCSYICSIVYVRPYDWYGELTIPVKRIVLGLYLSTPAIEFNKFHSK